MLLRAFVVVGGARYWLSVCIELMPGREVWAGGGQLPACVDASAVEWILKDAVKYIFPDHGTNIQFEIDGKLCPNSR